MMSERHALVVLSQFRDPSTPSEQRPSMTVYLEACEVLGFGAENLVEDQSDRNFPVEQDQR